MSGILEEEPHNLGFKIIPLFYNLETFEHKVTTSNFSKAQLNKISLSFALEEHPFMEEHTFLLVKRNIFMVLGARISIQGLKNFALEE